ncbi:hypothetical protein ACIB24_15885 [Spongisporangium articulatum]|uniref:Uncharacterized protein n=1 Tax=Spongisporangium articulatum TaxID=3362603 RepID=A0ABW8AQ92_9ACTN
MKRLPARGPALQGRALIASFDIDCGELLPGHRFVARGLGGPYELPIPPDWDGTDGEYERILPFVDRGSYPGFSLEYELVPGLPPLDPRDPIFPYLVGVAYAADVTLPWEPTDGGAIASPAGGASTHGSRGDWPLPPDARRLTFSLYPVGDDGRVTWDRAAGDLEVDVRTGSARWTATIRS